MKNISVFVILLFLILLTGYSNAVISSVQTSKFEALIGTWDVELTEMGMVMQFVFKMEDDTLAGSLEFDTGSGIMEEITFDENKLTCLVSIDAGGQLMNIDILAEVESEEMTGTMISDMGEAGFTAKKRKD